MYRDLSFDSAFFHRQVGELLLDEQPIDIPAGVDLLYVKSKTDLQPDLPGFVYSYGEKKLFYTKKLTAVLPPSTVIQSIQEVNYAIEQLYALAYESGRYSRFRLDPKFKREDFERLYRTWIDQSLDGQTDKDVLVYLVDGQLAGFLTYQFQEGAGELGLMAVSPKFQGRGIASALFQHVENLMLQAGVTSLTFPTQEVNLPACHFYAKQGYHVEQFIYLKHYYRHDSL